MVTYQDLNDLHRDILWSILRIETDGDQPTVDDVQEDVERDRNDDLSRNHIYRVLQNLDDEDLVERESGRPVLYEMTDEGRAMVREQADRRAALVDLADVDAGEKGWSA